MSEGQSALSTEEIDALLGGVDLPLGLQRNTNTSHRQATPSTVGCSTPKAQKTASTSG